MDRLRDRPSSGRNPHRRPASGRFCGFLVCGCVNEEWHHGKFEPPTPRFEVWCGVEEISGELSLVLKSGCPATETVAEFVSAETTPPTAQPASSGPFGAKREIPKFERVTANDDDVLADFLRRPDTGIAAPGRPYGAGRLLGLPQAEGGRYDARFRLR